MISPVLVLVRLNRGGLVFIDDGEGNPHVFISMAEAVTAMERHPLRVFPHQFVELEV